MSTIDPQEFQQLKEEVAALRTIISQWGKHIKMQSAEDENDPDHFTIHNCRLMTVNSVMLQGDDLQCRGMLCVEQEGPCLSLWGEKRTRMILRVKDDAGDISLYGPDGFATTQMYTDLDGHGNLFVFSPGGIPRAGVRAMATGGAVSVLKDDGTGVPCAVLSSITGEGQVAILSHNQVVARLHCTAEGGLISTSANDGKAGCTFASTKDNNTLFLFDPESGGVGCSMISGAAGHSLDLGLPSRLPLKSRGGCAVSLSNLPGIGGDLQFRNSEGHTVAEITSNKNGGMLMLKSGDEDHAKIQLLIQEGGGNILANSTADGCFALISAKAERAQLSVADQNRHMAEVAVDSKQTSFTIASGQAASGGFAFAHESSFGSLILANPDHSNAIALFTSETGGNLTLHGSDGTIQAGMRATENGGLFNIFNEVGVERAAIHSVQDGGGLKLKWGGTDGLIAASTEKGGFLVVNNAEGKPVTVLPLQGWETDESEDDEDE